MVVINEIKRDVVRRALQEGKRLDGRKIDEYRPIEIQKMPSDNADGSALCRIGKSQVLAGIKFDNATPYADRPTEGVFSTGAELLPIASPLFEVGPPREEAIELARIVDRGIRSAEIIDVNSFFVEEGKVLALYLDLYVLDHDGNLIDCAAMAGMSALLSARMPKIENGKIVRGEFAGPLDIKHKVVTCTFAKYEEGTILDPRLDEERGMDARLTIATMPGKVCATQKGGWGAFTRKQTFDLIETSLAKGNELRALL